MTVYLGSNGNIRLKRGVQETLHTLEDVIIPDDINTTLNRLSFDRSVDNIITGDRIEIATTDPRGLVCLPPSAWPSGVVQNNYSAWVNVNAVGGLRLYPDFVSAVNNTRANEIPLAAFVAPDLPITVSIRDVQSNVLGNVTGYQFNTDREAIDTTTLNDRFKNQYAAGLISGSGRIDCLFSYRTTGETETPALMLQVLQRLDVGSAFDCHLYLIDRELSPEDENVFYQISAVITRAGVEAAPDNIVRCSIDFVTTGEIRFIIGRPADFMLLESGDRLAVEQTIDFLLQDVTD